MTEPWKHLYDAMLSELERCWQLPVPEQEQVEQAFKIPLDYWECIKKEMAGVAFPDTAAEIHFYRHVKPGFTSWAEYLPLVYLGLSFEPKADQEMALLFWEAEARKAEKFKKRNAEFVEYYQSGSTIHDLQYFLAENCDLANCIISKVYDTDGEFMSSHDHLVAELLSHERYYGYIAEKIRHYRAVIGINWR